MAKDFDIRLENVKLMHETMLCMNNEDAYMVWIWTMPDCPTEEDFEWFAEDADEYNDLHKTFRRIADKYLADGLYHPTKEVVEFVRSQGYDISEITIFKEV